MRIVDLTHPFTASMPTFPGDPVPRLFPFAENEGCPLYELRTGLHVGTHMDAPLHFLPDGERISELTVERFIGRGVLLNARSQVTIPASLLDTVDLRRGDIVLVLTGFSSRFREPAYYRDYPEVLEEFASRLVQAGVSMLGLDTPSPDRAPYNVHRLLLQNGVLLLENLADLESLLGAPSFEVIALPLKLQAEAAPTRAIARIAP